MSQPHQYVTYIEQPLSYKEENLNTRNVKNVFRIRGPYSSNSDPLKFLKKKQNNLQKQTSVSSEEQKLKEQIEKLKTQQEKYKADREAYSEEYKNYRVHSLGALKRGDREMIKDYELNRQECV